MLETLSKTTLAAPPAVADLEAIKDGQQQTWATGDFSRLATHIHSTGERLVQTADLQIHHRTFVFRNRSADEFLDVFRTWFGPVIKAFEAIGVIGAADLESDLIELLDSWNRNTQCEALAMPSAYVEVVATRS